MFYIYTVLTCTLREYYYKQRLLWKHQDPNREILRYFIHSIMSCVICSLNIISIAIKFLRQQIMIRI
jgi:hypothetical protein